MIKKLNYNDLAFFGNISVLDAKLKIAEVLNIEDFTEKGAPKVKSSDLINVEQYDFKMKSNSRLEGKSRLEYLFNYYSKGRCDLNTLRKFSENKTFIKALRFTGKYQILNKILHKEHLNKLKKRWLQLSVLGKKNWHKNTINYLVKNPEHNSFLTEVGFSESEILNQIKSFEELK